MTNDENIKYLPTLVLEEIKAGKKCEITGSLCRNISTMEEYLKFLPQLRGKFGEKIQAPNANTVSIATRVIPDWAITAMEECIKNSLIAEPWLK